MKTPVRVRVRVRARISIELGHRQIGRINVIA